MSIPASRLRSGGRIERLVGGPYLELFARETAPGWTSHGDERTKFDSSSAYQNQTQTQESENMSNEITIRENYNALDAAIGNDVDDAQPLRFKEGALLCRLRQSRGRDGHRLQSPSDVGAGRLHQMARRKAGGHPDA